MFLNIFLKIMQFINKLGDSGGGQFFNVPTIISSYLKKQCRHMERKAVLLDYETSIILCVFRNREGQEMDISSHIFPSLAHLSSF